MGIKNIFITGKPGVGKTTLIIQLLRKLNIEAKGFYTQEIRNEKGQRTGFKIISLGGKQGILAAKDFSSNLYVGKYKVNLKDLEEIGVETVLEGLNDKNNLIVIDEIGKMELFSEKFKKAVVLALDSENKLLGTTQLSFNPFVDSIKDRKNCLFLNLTRDNREKIYKIVFEFLKVWGFLI